MAEMIPVRFKRATAMLDDIARARLYDCSSTSGSEHSAADGSVELGDLVLSYLETECEEDVDCRGSRDDDDIQLGSDDGDDNEDDDKVENTESKKKKNEKHINGAWSDPDQGQIETLRNLLHVGDKDAKAIQATVEAAIRAVPSIGKDGRGLMSELRRRGLDAGLCKSKWVKSGRLLSGQHVYVDVIGANGSRHIVEVGLAAEFEIARPSTAYLALLSLFPPIFVGRVDDLKRVVTIMYKAGKLSLKSRELLLPPWRCRLYMCSKWVASYKRTTNAISSSTMNDVVSQQSKKRVEGFTNFASKSKPERKLGFCKDDVNLEVANGLLLKSWIGAHNFDIFSNSSVVACFDNPQVHAIVPQKLFWL